MGRWRHWSDVGLERAHALAPRLRGRVQAAWREFRARSVYFQLKTLVVGAYAAIVVATVLWAPPPSLAKNEIGAKILVLGGDVVMGPYFVVENASRSHWKNARLTIDGGYSVTLDVVAAGDKLTLYVKDFKTRVVRKRRGREIPRLIAAPSDMKLTQLKIECSEGMAIEPLEQHLGSTP